MASLCLTNAATAFAQIEDALPGLDLQSVPQVADNSIMLIVFVGAFAFTMWASTWLIRERRKLEENNRALALENADLKSRNSRSEALLDVPDQRVVIWAGRAEAPVCHGTLPANSGAPDDPSGFAAFGTWMTPHSAKSFELAVERLRERAEAFDLTVESRNGTMIEVQGRASGSHAFVRFINLSGDRAALANLELQHTKLLQTTDTMQSLLKAAPFPVWLRDADGGLSWTNPSYVKAVESASLDDVLAEQPNLLDAPARDALAQLHKEAQGDGETSIAQKRIPATVSGDRRMVDVSEVIYGGGSAGLAIDMNEVEDAQNDLRRTLESHARTMNQLATAVAIFDENKHLVFTNQSFETLWQLDDPALLKQPSNGQLFDMLRDHGKIAEHPDWSKWRNGLLDVYNATEPQEHWWHLPDGRTVRVVASPHQQGGVTWVFENVTEQLEMESRYIALMQVQGETLDHLAEAIAVFGSDGRLRLSNPSFQSLWGLEDEQVSAQASISDIADACRETMKDAGNNAGIWDQLITEITGVQELRNPVSGRFELATGNVIDYALVPLPNGQNMLSFADVTANVNLEHTLKERNEALQAAERLKNAFIEHVSYEFRAPLTNIKGFSEVLEQEVFGKLNEKQHEYVSHITSSAGVVHSLVDNLLDLATVDAGIMELDFQPLNLRKVINGAARSITGQLKARGVQLTVRHAAEVEPETTFIADATRVQQVLFNLLNNAISFSPEAGTVVLESRLEDDDVVFRVRDAGPGIPEEERASIFERFQSRSQTGGRRGAGLGLAISRSLVELHGGRIFLDGSVRKGSCFVCRFPKNPTVEEDAATKTA